jgi:DNA-binding CsgD family transcriptional regulator
VPPARGFRKARAASGRGAARHIQSFFPPVPPPSISKPFRRPDDDESTSGGAVEPARFRGPVGNSHLPGARAIAPGVHFQAGRNVTFIRGLARWAGAHLQALGLSLLLVITASTVLWFFAFFVPDRREAAIEDWRRELSLRADHERDLLERRILDVTEDLRFFAAAAAIRASVRKPAGLPPVDPLISVSPLTGRERGIVLMLSNGYASINIAARLNLSHATVRNHIQNALRKLEVHSQVEAVALSFRRGWI